MPWGDMDRKFWMLCCWLALACAPGCVQRRLTIRSNPPGAAVYVDNYQIGTTPCSTDYIYYGTRDIRLVKDGYETLTVRQPIPAPWYQYFPLDFVAENLVPTEIRDERTIDYQMQPQAIVPTGQLLNRAEGLRQDSQPGGLSPPVLGSGPAFTPPGGWSPSALPPDALPPDALPPNALPPDSQPGILPQPELDPETRIRPDRSRTSRG